MLNSWLQVFQSLSDFVAQHPEITLSPYRISIPEESRSEFWHRFDNVGQAFLKEKFPALCHDALRLSESYRALEWDVTGSYGIDRISVPFYLQDFFHNPINAYVNAHLFELVMDLVKGKVDTSTFEKNAALEVNNSMIKLCQTAYEKWVILALLKMLPADRLYEVNVPEIESHEKHQTPILKDRPMPVESNHLTLQHDGLFIVMAPDFMARLANGSFVGVKSNVSSFGDFTRCIMDDATERETFPNRNVPRIEPPATLVYTGSQAQDIALLGGMNKILRPDLIIEYRWQAGWFNDEGLSRVQARHDMLQPRLGTFVLSKEMATETAAINQGDIRILSAGFDRAKLEPVSSRLTQANSGRALKSNECGAN